MKTVTFNIDNQNISYSVNWLGIETITVNNIIISKKLSLPRRKHKFDLEVFGKTERFYITSKQGFSSGNIKVQLYHNDICIDEKTLDFNLSLSRLNNDGDPLSNNVIFMVGIMFIVLTLCLDWSKFFLFLGLVFMFSGMSTKENPSKSSDANNDVRQTN